MKEIPQYQWKTRVKKGPLLWGYRDAEGDEEKGYMYPIPEALNALEAAKDYIDRGYSYRESAKWLSAYAKAVLGKDFPSMSHAGLKKRYIQDNERLEKEND